MTIQLHNVTLDCTDPLRVAAFWSDALDRPIDDGASDGFVSIGIGGPYADRVVLHQGARGQDGQEPRALRSPRRRPGRGGRTAARRFGATKVGDYDEYGTRWTTLRDVEGNEFCVA